MVETQLMNREIAAAVLALVAIPGKDVSPIQVQVLFREAVVGQEPDHSGNLDLEVHRADPILVRLLRAGTRHARLAPGVERVVRKDAFLDVNHLGQFTAQQSERAANADDVYGQIEAIEHQDAGAERARRGRTVCNVGIAARFPQTGRPGGTLIRRASPTHWKYLLPARGRGHSDFRNENCGDPHDPVTGQSHFRDQNWKSPGATISLYLVLPELARSRGFRAIGNLPRSESWLVHFDGADPPQCFRRSHATKIDLEKISKDGLPRLGTPH